MWRVLYIAVCIQCMLHSQQMMNSLRLRSIIPKRDVFQSISVIWMHRWSSIRHRLDVTVLIIPLRRIDLTAGSIYMSHPELYYTTTIDCNHTAASIQSGLLYLIPLFNRDSSSSIQDPRLAPQSSYRSTALLKVHQVSAKLLRKVPDYALIGAFTLIVTELLKREVAKQLIVLPPKMQEFMNKTMVELDTKLETITSLQFDIDPFLKSEYDKLQAQPIEIIDKFITTDIIKRVETDFPPLLKKFLRDDKTIYLITQKVLELVRLVSIVLLRPGTLSVTGRDAITTTTTIITTPTAFTSTTSNQSSDKTKVARYPFMKSFMLSNGNRNHRYNNSASASLIIRDTTYPTNLTSLTAISEFNRILDELSGIAKSESILQQLFLSIIQGLLPGYSTSFFTNEGFIKIMESLNIDTSLFSYLNHQNISSFRSSSEQYEKNNYFNFPDKKS